MKRRLPRFEVIEVRAGARRHFLAYDHLAKVVVFPPNLLSYDQAEGLVRLLAARAREEGATLSVEREDTPPVKPPKGSRSTTDGPVHRP